MGPACPQTPVPTIDRALPATVTGQPRCGVLPFFDRSNPRTMKPTATLSSKYQICIPKAIRAAQHWEAGVTFAFIPKGTGVLLVPVPRLQTLKGIARGASPEGYRDRSDRV